MKKKWLVTLLAIFVLLVAVWELAAYLFVLKDAQKTAEDIREGKAVWSEYYNLDLAENLNTYLMEEENPGIVTQIMKNAEIEAEVSAPLFNRSKVVFTISTINYEGFVKYCVTNEIIEYEQALVEFENYKTTGTRTTYEVPVTWKWNVVNYEKNLQDRTFVDAATGGFISYYSEIMNAAEEDLEKLLGGQSDETED